MCLIQRYPGNGSLKPYLFADAECAAIARGWQPTANCRIFHSAFPGPDISGYLSGNGLLSAISFGMLAGRQQAESLAARLRIEFEVIAD